MNKPNEVRNILVPYEDLMELKTKASERDMLVNIMEKDFHDEECRMMALRAVLDLPEPEPEVPEVPDEPTEEIPEEEP